MARHVLVVLADEARDARGGRSSLTTAQIAARTGLSRRTIHRAYVILDEAGQITREAVAPGAALATLVHPRIISDLPRADLAEGSATVSDPLCQPVRGSIVYIDKPLTSSPQAQAREPVLERVLEVAAQLAPDPTPNPVALDPVDEVFDAWDAMAAQAGLPGPVTRDTARRVAIAARLSEHKRFRVLASIAAVGRSDFLRGKRRDGQGDWRASFDWVFEVGRYSGMRHFLRLLEGDFTAEQVPMAPQVAHAEKGQPEIEQRPEESPETRTLRASLGERLGPAVVRTWIAPLRFDWGGEGLAIIAPNRFHADHVAAEFAGVISKAAGHPVRVVTREKAW